MSSGNSDPNSFMAAVSTSLSCTRQHKHPPLSRCTSLSLRMRQPACSPPSAQPPACASGACMRPPFPGRPPRLFKREARHLNLLHTSIALSAGSMQPCALSVDLAGALALQKQCA
jgi:hypothetical protein